jgi:hypothetical protein
MEEEATPAKVRPNDGLGGCLPERRADGMPASADERLLRRLLARRVGMPSLYFDDGEASAQEHGISIDFMREPVVDIGAKLMALNVARLEVKPLLPYYIGAPYHDGSYAMCVTATGKVVHREPPNAKLTGQGGATCAAEMR